ncbi:hypothetical protein DPMN_165988 [Dreissena polymorpha]|uniref:Uncharacterized protein n=1 Tax=Dreissena polymorpha TaxID=45954 RepID=A0A9D4EX66_DREPO|nr:hypothetical protein DPMN_165988 [Dreissena polymorpha]
MLHHVWTRSVPPHFYQINLLDSRKLGRTLNFSFNFQLLRCYLKIFQFGVVLYCGGRWSWITLRKPHLSAIVTTNQTHMLPGTAIEAGSPR